MNNAVFYEYADSAVAAWHLETGALDVPRGPVICLAAETACVYHAGLAFPDPVDVGMILERLGGRSMVWRIGLFRGDAPDAAADIRFVHVCVDSRTHRPTPLPDTLRRAAETMLG